MNQTILRGTRALALAALVACVTACPRQNNHESDDTRTTGMPSTRPTTQEWVRFAQLRIAFGHQSVGTDILSGINMLAREDDQRLTVVEGRHPQAGPRLQHFAVGSNGDPEAKLRDFASLISEGMGGTVDVAMVKLCYIDFDRDGDPLQLAQNYIATIDALSARFPDTTFVAMTAPITTVQTGPKALIKRMLGRSPAGLRENAQRQIFNDALRAHYTGASQLFDIAALESDSRRNVVVADGKPIETLDARLTYDGGHLNDAGKRLIGGALVRHLALIPPRSPVESD